MANQEDAEIKLLLELEKILREADTTKLDSKESDEIDDILTKLNAVRGHSEYGN